MLNNIKKDTESNMEKSLQNFKKNILKIRTNRASPHLLDGILVEYYGKKVPIRQLASVVLDDSVTLKVNVFDSSVIKLIEKAIMNANLGLNPYSKGNTILVPLPSLTESRRKELIKIIKHASECSRISIRNIRRDANVKIKNFLKKKIINEDAERLFQNEIQNMTDNFIKKIDVLLSEKEKDLMVF
ncbi:ribosome recycling factor [Buchnera aphidicola (Pemphigus obesinymphae)]|uniref:ribosome recycling factor n=1 Tax=Buchnera aphidicola TaxID=9 RepID=UPI0022382EED|nr:ribosome recycling factor [Buchnera aphidicola]MCW5196474.1 ribosome recycling factor [Buchnera aphidicola (Pemphigus obesinymphae)]